MDQDATWYGARPRPRRLCIRWGPSPFPQKGAEPPAQFSAHFYCGQTAGCIKMPLGIEVGLSPEDVVLDVDPAPFSRIGGGARGRNSPISAQVYCGQTVGWIKMTLAMEVGLGPIHIVLDGDTAPLPKRVQNPQFSVHLCCGQTAGCIKMPLGMEVGLSPGNVVLDRDPAPKRGGAPPNFRPTSIVATRLRG